MNKSELRKRCLTIRDNLTDIPKLSERMWAHLYSTDEYKLCKNLLVYASIGSEPHTDPLINRAFTDGKNVFCPRINGKEMDFYRIDSYAELKPNGKYNIPEPPIVPERLFIPTTDHLTFDTICIVPALCIDERGYRLGYGGGYYDRYFRKISDICCKIYPIAAIFSSLSTNYFLNEPFDVPAKMIITEDEIKRIGGQYER